MTEDARPFDADDLLAHAAWLRGLARSLVADEHAAEDVVQETLAAAIERPPRDGGALRGWLARVARNAAWKTIRTRRRRAAREFAAGRSEAQPSSADVLDRLETQRVLLEAVRALDEPYRTVVVMRFYDAKTPRQIAEELGLPSEVVWKRLSRAVAMLRARLDTRYGDREAWAGMFVLWLDGPSRVARTAVAVKSATAVKSSAAAAVGTGVATMGTKAIVAAAVGVAALLWLAWPRGESAGTAVGPGPKPDGASDDTAAAKPAPGARRPRAAEEPAAPEPSGAPRPHAKIRGRVIDAETGEPLVGARVNVIRTSPSGGFMWRVETGADGTFAGEVEESGRYSADLGWSAVKAPLYVEASARGHIRFYEGPWTGLGADGGEDLGDLKLWRGTAVRGIVVRADDSPVPRALVYATSGAREPGHDFALQHARKLGQADDAGRFELDEGLPPTSGGEVYTLLASCPEGVAFTTVAIRKGGDAVEVELKLKLATANVRVVDDKGNAVAGAEVRAQPHFGPFRGAMAQGQHEIPEDVGRFPELATSFTRTTGTDGRARFDTLPAGENGSSYEFMALSPGFAAIWTDMRSVGAVADGEIEIRLVPELALVAGGRVVDADGVPVEGAAVTQGRGTAVATSGADGAFVVARKRGALGGREWFSIEKTGFAKRQVVVPYVVDDGSPLAEIRLERPAPIEGTVLDQDDHPVAGAWVVVQRQGASLNGPGDGKTGADGRFSFPNATPGEWRITVVPPSGAGTFIQPPDMPVRGGTRDAIVRVERLPEARARVSVDVVDADTGQPIDARDAYFFRSVHTWNGMPSPPEPKIEHGRIVIDPVHPGDYVLWIGVEDRPQQVVRVHVDESATRAVATHRVRRGVTLTGRVRAPEDFDGWPVNVSIEPVGRVPMPYRWDFATLTAYGRATVGADGAFRIEGRTATRYRVRVGKKGWLGETTVDASEGDASFDLEIRRGTIVRFRGSDPIEIAYVRVEGSMDGGPWTTISQIGVGEDHLIDDTETMTPGAWRWRVTLRKSFMSNDVADAAEPQSGELLLEAGKDVEVVIPVVVRR